MTTNAYINIDGMQPLEIDHLGESYRIESGKNRTVLTQLHDAGFTFMVDLLGADTGESVEAIYHLRNLDTIHDIFVREAIPYGGTLTSVWDIYHAALMPERELCEMYGLTLAGHPNPKRLVTTDGCEPFLLKSTKIRTADEVHNRHRQVMDITNLDRHAGSIAADGSDPNAIEHCDEFSGNLGRPNTYCPPCVPKSIARAVSGVDQVNSEHLIINMGPQHPSTHGVLRVLVELDGEQIVTGEAMIGQLHRGIEKLGEHRAYNALGTLMDRGDYASGIHGELAAALATEKLMEVDVPRRAQWLRSLTSELNRIGSHMVWFGPSCLDAGMMGLFLYVWKDREDVLDILEDLTGARMMFNYIRPGGVLADMTPTAAKKITKFCDEFIKRMDEHEELVMDNEILRSRIKDVFIINPQMAIDFGLTGANLRASGCDFDVRKAMPYAAYDELEFEVPTTHEGDIYARFDVRINELRQSCLMIKQCIEGLPEGEIMAKMPKTIKPPAGEAYGAVESPRGEVGIHIISDGTSNPSRFRYRPPALYALQAGEALLPGQLIADAVVGLGSLDFVLGEIDR